MVAAVVAYIVAVLLPGVVGSVEAQTEMPVGSMMMVPHHIACANAQA